MTSKKPIVLRLGEDIKYNHKFFADVFTERFQVVANEEPDRASFIKALKEKKYGDFSAIFRPHFQTGGEMGQWDDELIDLLPPSVRIFASAGAGFNWADVDALGRRSIWYANGAGCSDEAVSDTALFMILSVFRNFWRSQKGARTCNPDDFTATHKLVGSISFNPRGHILGIVGLGNISKLLAHKAQAALGMEIHYYDVVRAPTEVEEKLQATYHATLHELLGVADCVTLHTPLNAHTQDLMNDKAFAAMKDGARLVNTARGQVVNEDALIAALESGKISAAGIDVHYHEPQVSKVLAAMDNVTMTCHNGGAAITTRINFELNAMKNILEVVGSDGEIRAEPITPSKCIPISADECERCKRLGKNCVYLDVVAKRKSPAGPSRVKLLEQKVNSLLSLLDNRPQDTSVDRVISQFRPEDLSELSRITGRTLPLTLHRGPTHQAPLDVIDRGLITRETAQSLLDDYCAKAVHNFPFVPIPIETDINSLRLTRPFLCLCIMYTMMVKNCTLQRQLGEEVRVQLHKRILLESENSLELLQGLLVYLAWYQYHYTPEKQQIVQLAQLCVALVQNLGLDQNPGNSKRTVNLGPDETEPYRGSARTTDQLRALLGAYCISSWVATKFRGRGAMPYTKYIEQTHQFLSTLKEYPTDELISLFVRLNGLARRICDTFAYDDLDNAEIRGEPISIATLQGFTHDLYQEVWYLTFFAYAKICRALACLSGWVSLSIEAPSMDNNLGVGSGVAGVLSSRGNTTMERDNELHTLVRRLQQRLHILSTAISTVEDQTDLMILFSEMVGAMLSTHDGQMRDRMHSSRVATGVDQAQSIVQDTVYNLGDGLDFGGDSMPGALSLDVDLASNQFEDTNWQGLLNDFVIPAQMD
ncbi:hypothetical protein FDECE_5402 [Fusarium decemcellulare]|nr:hypothetical protein FDECE_5402 [Fusarium decemcellulare]